MEPSVVVYVSKLNTEEAEAVSSRLAGLIVRLSLKESGRRSEV